MKKTILSFILSVSMLCLSVSTALSEHDLSLKSMSFEELNDLQIAIQAELRSRPESGISILQIGDYVIGRDINPGEYYFRPIDDPYYACGFIKVFADEEQKSAEDGRSLFAADLNLDGRSSVRVQLYEGQVLSILIAPMQMSKVDFPVDDYSPPEGVNEPAGYYEVGIDLPAGRYTVHYDGKNAGEVRVYPNMESFQEHGLGSYIFRETLEYLQYSYSFFLEDGNVLQLYCPVIITQKEPAMLFD